MRAYKYQRSESQGEISQSNGQDPTLATEKLSRAAASYCKQIYLVYSQDRGQSAYGLSGDQTFVI